MHRHSLFLAVISAFATIASPAAPAKQMFTTLETGTARLGDWVFAGGAEGVAAANAICVDRAANAGLANASAYRAWISDATTDAWCNVAGFGGRKEDNCGEASLPDAGPWVRTDGKPFSRALSDLTATDEVFYVANLDQHGNLILDGITGVLTGTEADGAWSPLLDCDGWTSGTVGSTALRGELNAGAQGWTSWSSFGCESAAHLLCFESGVGPPLEAFGAPGAYAFVTSTFGLGNLSQWPDSNGQHGIAAGDAICKAAAVRGHLPAPDSYVAWLSDTSTNAIDRLTFGGPWRRPDGPEIAADKGGLAQTPHAASIDVDELGAHVVSYAFTGTDNAGMATTSDCAGWQADAGSATVGIAPAAADLWSSGASSDCSVVFSLYCFSNVPVLFADGFEKFGSFYWSESFAGP